MIFDFIELIKILGIKNSNFNKEIVLTTNLLDKMLTMMPFNKLSQYFAILIIRTIEYSLISINIPNISF